jgi:DUF1680 family protein
LFAPSVVRWQRPRGVVEVEQTTNYPAEDTSRLTIKTGGSFALKLRIPAWTQGASVRVNGRAAVTPPPGGYAVIERSWKVGDVVDVTIPQPWRMLPIDESHPDIVALLRGAVLYVGLNPWEGIEQTAVTLPAALQPLNGRKDAAVLRVNDKSLVVVPYYDVQLESYHTYFKRS